MSSRYQDYIVQNNTKLCGEISEINGYINIADSKNIPRRIADSKTRIAYNCIERNNCATVNWIFITPRAIRESSMGQYERKERRTNQAGIFIGNITGTKVFIRALGDVVTSIFVNLIEVPDKMANGSCAESAVTCTRLGFECGRYESSLYLRVGTRILLLCTFFLYTFFSIFSARSTTNQIYRILSIFEFSF